MLKAKAFMYLPSSCSFISCPTSCCTDALCAQQPPKPQIFKQAECLSRFHWLHLIIMGLLLQPTHQTREHQRHCRGSHQMKGWSHPSCPRIAAFPPGQWWVGAGWDHCSAGRPLPPLPLQWQGSALGKHPEMGSQP